MGLGRRNVRKNSEDFLSKYRGWIQKGKANFGSEKKN